MLNAICTTAWIYDTTILDREILFLMIEFGDKVDFGNR
jgi:hypothetical protein